MASCEQTRCWKSPRVLHLETKAVRRRQTSTENQEETEILHWAEFSLGELKAHPIMTYLLHHTSIPTKTNVLKVLFPVGQIFKHKSLWTKPI